MPRAGETIRGLLAPLGAHGAELRLEEEGVFAWARAEANRLANADAGNLRRQARAAEEQIAAIEADTAASSSRSSAPCAPSAASRPRIVSRLLA